MDELIDGVIVKPLKIIKDERGAVMHMLRSDDQEFTAFGEVYFSIINAGVVKGWKQHTQQTQRLAVIDGSVEFVLYDKRENSETSGKVYKAILNQENYCLLIIPPGVVYAFKALSDTKAIVANCADIPHCPDEGRVYDINDASIPYSWS